MSRVAARTKAFQLIFEYLVRQEPCEETFTVCVDDEALTDEDKLFIRAVYDGAVAHMDEIKALIAQKAIGYDIGRIYRVDLAILVEAIYEFKFMGNIKAVCCNEAVELAKLYSTNKSPSYINGILANI